MKNRISDLGILYLSDENKAVLRKTLEEYGLEFVPLFSAKPHVFLQKNHPLAQKQTLKLAELEPYPRLNKEIRVNDRGAIVNFMLGLNAYTISSGIFPKYLHGDNIIAIPLDEPERMEIGYIHLEKQPLSELGAVYIHELKKYAPVES